MLSGCFMSGVIFWRPGTGDLWDTAEVAQAPVPAQLSNVTISIPVSIPVWRLHLFV